MVNHLNLAVQVGEIPLSRCMQNPAFRYTWWVNRREKRAGYLFQGCYQAVLLDRDIYLLEQAEIGQIRVAILQALPR
jgi:hypothetical protein